MQPEHIKSLELGYKGIFLDARLKVDADFYYNKYNNFIAQIEMNVPATSIIDSIPYYLNNRSQQSRYRIYTNSKSIVYNLGGSFGLSYLFGRYLIGGNASYAKLNRTDNGDGFEDGFNTPTWMTNFSFSGDHVIGNFSFNITYKHQSSFYWQSFLVSGNVKPYGNIDAQANYQFVKEHLNVKIGATNLLNRYYNSFMGGPSIGGLYYTTVTYRL